MSPKASADNSLFRGNSPESSAGDVQTAMQFEADLGVNASADKTLTTLNDEDGMDVEQALDIEAPAPPIKSQDIQISRGNDDGQENRGTLTPQTLDIPNSQPAPEKKAHSNGGDQLLASLPVYYNTSLPSTSSLQIFQYPTYPRSKPLPLPDSARSRGLHPALRYRPKAKRVEMELPLDLRPTVYDLDKGEEYARGAAAGGTIGSGPKSATQKVKKEVKREYGTYDAHSNGKRRLEKTRLESSQVPHQTRYMIGVIRDGRYKKRTNRQVHSHLFQAPYISPMSTVYTNCAPRCIT